MTQETLFLVWLAVAWLGLGLWGAWVRRSQLGGAWSVIHALLAGGGLARIYLGSLDFVAQALLGTLLLSLWADLIFVPLSSPDLRLRWLFPLIAICSGGGFIAPALVTFLFTDLPYIPRIGFVLGPGLSLVMLGAAHTGLLLFEAFAPPVAPESDIKDG